MSLLATLGRLYKSKVAATGKLPLFDLVLPLIDIWDEFPTYCNSGTDLEGCTYTLHDADHALRHSYYLLVLLVDVSSSAADTYEATPFFQGYLAWILDGFLLLREVERAWGPSFAIHRSAAETCILSVRAVQSLLLSMGRLLPTTLKCKGYSVLARLCTELCEYPDVLSETSVEIIFCTTLLDLAANSVHHEPIAQAVRFQLLPALQDYQDSQSESGSQNPDTIVCTSHFISKAVLIMA
jgi:serine/threonine-protein kinase ATR